MKRVIALTLAALFAAVSVNAVAASHMAAKGEKMEKKAKVEKKAAKKAAKMEKKAEKK